TYGVGVKDMDDQHKKLFALINDYYEAITQKKAKEAVAALLQGLLGYVRYHFGDEERLIFNAGGPLDAVAGRWPPPRFDHWGCGRLDRAASVIGGSGLMVA
ncbi:MAG: hemerythrin family protein, partial [Candidatus Riflebacteria bacterium]|nr:hemerythrin family protein [Candidatus Riflebacteria bacterium]